MKNPKNEGIRWFEQAERDLDAARIIYKQGLWWIVCFQAQQAAEKAVKAFLYSSGERLVVGHSVAELLKSASRLNPAFESLVMSGSFLDRFYIPTRYPNGLPGGIPADTYSEADASEAIEKANAIIDAVRTAL